jgi:flagellar hook-basal body complex protein FliE
MTIKIADAAAAYANAAKIAGPGLPAREAGGNFADFPRQATESAVGTLKQGEAASLQAVAGKADLTQLVTAVNNAEVTLQTVASLRDRMVQAYQEILRMPI